MRTASSSSWWTSWTVGLGLVAAWGVSNADGRATARDLPPLVVTQLPVGTAAEKAGPRSGGMLPANWGEGARLVRVRDGRVEKVLTPGLRSAADPDVSLDGTRILFAGQRAEGDPWSIFEMAADGSDLRQIYATRDDLRQPIYLPTVYTIVADPTKGTEPREHVGFVRVFRDLRNEYGDAASSALFSVKRDGTEPRRLTYGLSNEMTPTVLRDGRIVYSGWQRASLERGFEGRISLIGINADGLDPAIFSADEGRRIKSMPCATPGADRLVVFVEAERVGWDGAGTLASVSLRRNLHSHRRITQAEAGLFHSPSPLADGTLVAAHRSARGNHGIVRVDPASGRFTPVFDDPAFHEMQPRALAPRLRPDHRSSAVQDPDEAPAAHAGPGAVPEAKLYALDVYQNDLGVDLPTGTIARVRVMEGVPRAASHAPERRTAVAPGIPGASERGLTPSAVRRLVGEAPVEPDGSFHLSVPAERPLQLQMLDQDGLALRSSGWIWVQYRGRQGCVGCHENAELAPSNRLVAALKRPSNRLVLPPELRRTVDYRNDIAPIVAARCSSCHDETHAIVLDEAPGASGVFSRGYETLMAGLSVDAGGRVVGRHVHPGSARTSPLIWHILGRNTARPWDGPAADIEPTPMTPQVRLGEDERRLFIEWIDMGALFDATLDGTARAEAAASHQGESQ